MKYVDHAELNRVLQYDSDSGLFKWKVRSGPKCAGSLAGRKSRNGYMRIGINGRDYYSHILAWFYMTGEWPESEIDHKDQNKLNNAFCNLRIAKTSQNHINTGVRKDNSLGVKGVYLDKRRNRYYATIHVFKKKLSLGSFTTLDGAKAAYLSAVKKHYGEFAPAEAEYARNEKQQSKPRNHFGEAAE